MHRNKLFATDLLDFLVDNDHDGGGLFRGELRQLFCASPSKEGLDQEDMWNVVDYHLHLLETAGFVKVTPDPENRDHDNFEMTWAGHDFSGR